MVNNFNFFYQTFAFSRIGAKLWNAIPTNIRNLPKDKFKKRIRAFLFEVLESGNSYYGLEEIICKVNKHGSYL